MYGLVNQAIEELIIKHSGPTEWKAIKKLAGVEVDVFISNETYPDAITYRLVAAAAEVLRKAPSEILAAFGEHWVATATQSYGPLLKSSGKNLREFLINLPNFHTRIAMIYPKMKPPAFLCTNVTEWGCHLHYITHREGLSDFVRGVLTGLGHLYGTPCSSTLIQSKGPDAPHDIFDVRWEGAAAI